MTTLDYDQLFGSKRGELTVLGLLAIQGTIGFPSRWKWVCECSCGTVVIRQASSILNEYNKHQCCKNCRAPYGTRIKNYSYQMR